MFGVVCVISTAYIGAVTRIYRWILTLFVRSKTTKSMNTSGEESEDKLQSEIKKEVEKLKYYVDNADEIIEEGDYNEIKIINNRTAVILDKINTLVANVQELKIDRGETARNVRQWKKEIKSSTVDALKKNTYVNNLMHGGEDVEDLVKFKEESSTILESGKFRVHKWQSNVAALESEGMPNPTKFMGHKWDKREETLEVTVPSYQDDELVTKRSVLSHLGSIYDPLGIISPTLAEGKRIYREVCEEKRGWNAEVSPKLIKAPVVEVDQPITKC